MRGFAVWECHRTWEPCYNHALSAAVRYSHVNQQRIHMTIENKGVQLLDVAESSAGQRIDNFLTSRLKGVPRSHLYRLIRKGEIRVNKKRVKPETRLQHGDIVRIAPIQVVKSETLAPPSQGLVDLLRQCILFENDQLMVINKPQGLAVHAGSGLNAGLIEALRDIFSDYSFLELAHRIDKDTSGCLLIAKTSKALKHLQGEIKARKLQKTYLALVHGSWPQSVTKISAPLLKKSAEAGSGIVTVSEEGKTALTNYVVEKRFKGATLMQAMPITGRTHQIRVHCQYAGHPIVGDNKYTPTTKNALSQEKHLCLHAAMLNFSLPDAAERITVQAPVAGNMAALIGRLEAD